jgi:predicted O-methyltransferase YrrM
MEIRPHRFAVVYTAPSLMTMSERVVLYSTVFGLRPQRCLEIGTSRGGSALIITAALDDLGAGKLVCIDFNPQVAPEDWRRLSHRASLLAGPSAQMLPQAVEYAGGPFDFAFIDGDHELPGAYEDIAGVVPLLADPAYLLCHDAHYHCVQAALTRALREYPNRLHDCGMVSVEKYDGQGDTPAWGGLRLLRYACGN